MKELVSQIHTQIKDYRNDDGIFLTEEDIFTWINQFDSADREIVLSELNHILPKSYLSKDAIKQELKDLFEYLIKHYKYESVPLFLQHIKILSCQEEHKSQTKLLSFLNDFMVDQYGVALSDCGKNTIKYWLYIDDILASGGTFTENISEKIEEYGKEEFKSSSIKIISVIFFLHNWGENNCVYQLGKNYDIDFRKYSDFHYIHYIDNNPRIHHYYNASPKFNLAYSIETELGNEFLNNLEEKLNLKYELTKGEFAFRPTSLPTKEEFFSDTDNRNRYEYILFKKGVEIFNKIDTINAKGIRPLGFTRASYKTLGTGSHAFTWRNISNTCPLVFWWENHGWIPLFKVANRGK